LTRVAADFSGLSVVTSTPALAVLALESPVGKTLSSGACQMEP
jgi:hypothetical protein